MSPGVPGLGGGPAQSRRGKDEESCGSCGFGHRIPVRPEHRLEIFKPYFTTNEHGTGLGLAIVRQIVSAHGWKIECLSNEPRGAIFRIMHIRSKG